MPLADTPITWDSGPSISTLHALAIFAGIPLLVILMVSLLIYAPSWVHGPRYRLGQPWESKSQWFGTSVAADPVSGVVQTQAAEGVDAAEPGAAAAPSTGSGGDHPRQGATAASRSDTPPHPEQGSGGASATW